MNTLEAVVGSFLILWAGIILSILVKKLVGDWIPSVFYKGGINHILEDVHKIYNPEFEEINSRISKVQNDLHNAFKLIQEEKAWIKEAEKTYSERLTRLETLREEDKSLIRELKESVTRLEEKIDSRITRLEDRLAESHNRVVGILKTMSMNINNDGD